jgi:NAD(P)H-quinone oxidoreductase subunit M
LLTDQLLAGAFHETLETTRLAVKIKSQFSLLKPMEAPPLLKSTTRHIRIFTAEVMNNEFQPSNHVLTLDVDPDNELNWDDDTLQQVYRKFDDLVESYSGEDLTDYNLRRIGSDLEHFVRSLLQKGQISYNLNSRVRNFSMGVPRVVSADLPSSDY